jgi:hypothetical protein
MCHVTVLGGEMSPKERDAYVQYATEKYGREPNGLTIRIDGDYVDLDVQYHNPFTRIRRISGYLVGSLDRWNDGKRSEERDRVKHGIA